MNDVVSRLKKGDVVKVKSHGEILTKRVWDVDDRFVYLCTEDSYQKSLTSKDARVLPGAWPINNIDIVSVS